MSLQIDGLKVILYTVLLNDAIDGMRGTSLYRHKVKQVGNNLSKLLDPLVAQLDSIYDSDAELTMNIQNELDSLVEKLAKRNLVDLVMLNQMHDHYAKNPKDWDDLLKRDRENGFK